MTEFRAIGLSYKKTPIHIRELVSFEAGNDAENLLLRLKEIYDVEEALVISTCNRTELYYSAKEDLTDGLIKLISSLKGVSSSDLFDHFDKFEAKDAINQLFRVSVGLESKVLGDIQISNQVKKAYQLSADLSLSGPFLHRLMHTIFYANKRVVQETRLQDGTASVASVAVDIIESFIPKMENPRIALLGLGEIGQYVLENLRNQDAKLTLANRTKSKAEFFASKVGADVRDLESLNQLIAENDVIISAVSGKDLLISTANILERHTHKLFIDLSMPRSIDSQLELMPGISLYNVDQLSERTMKARAIREAAIPMVETIIGESLNGLQSWKSEMEVSPTIKKLKSALDSIRKEELARHAKLNDEERKLLEVVTKNMMQKVIKLPVLQLKAACKRGEAETLVGVLNDLFDLEKQEQEKT